MSFHHLLLPSAANGVARAGALSAGAGGPADLPAAFVVPAVSAVAIATLGLVALLFFARDRSRTDLLLYALLGAGLVTFLAAGLAGSEGPARRLATALAVSLPPLAYLLLLRFLELPLSRPRAALLAAAPVGLVLVLAMPRTGGLRL